MRAVALTQQRLERGAEAGAEADELADIAGVSLADAAVGVQRAHRAAGDDDRHDEHGLWSTTTKPAEHRGVAGGEVGLQQHRRR